MADAAAQQAAQLQAAAAVQAGRAEALSGAAAQGTQAPQAVHEAQGGQSIRKSLEMGAEGPIKLDPRFDRDDLRQGHPPPAIRKRLTAIRKMRRPRKLKGTPFKRNKAKEESEGVEEVDMTDEEVEVTDEEAEAAAIAAEGEEEKKSGGLLAKVLGK